MAGAPVPTPLIRECHAILALDADEWVTPELREEIRAAVTSNCSGTPNSSSPFRGLQGRKARA